MDADTLAAFQGLNAKIDDLTSLGNFLLSRVLLMSNDVQSLRQAIAAMATSVTTIAGGLSAQGTQLGDIQTKLAAENTAIGTLSADVRAVADLVEQLRQNNPELPGDVFDSLGAIQTQLTTAAQAAQASATSLQTIATSIDGAAGAVTEQANALQNVVTPPAPTPTPAG